MGHQLQVSTMWLMTLLLAASVNCLLTNQSDKVCMSKKCNATSQRLLDNMNVSADPCEDFNEFACGKFLRNAVIPDDRLATELAVAPMMKNYIEQTRKLLEDNSTKKSEFISDQLIRNYYKSCLNEKKKKQLGLEPFKETLKKFGGWPLLEGEKWDPGCGEWYDVVLKMNMLGLSNSYILKIDVTVDLENNNYQVLSLDQPSLTIDRTDLIKGFDDDYIQEYYWHIVEESTYIGADDFKARQEMKEALLFEIALANISSSGEERRDIDKLYNPTTIGDFKEQPGFPPSLKRYINELFISSGVHDIKIEDNDKLVIKDLSFINNLSNLLARTSSRVIANYLAWRAYSDVKPLLKEKEDPVNDEIWKNCIESCGIGGYVNFFTIAASSLYFRSHFQQEYKKPIENMIKELKDSFTTTIVNLDWMDNETKEDALKKVRRMGSYIGSPDEFSDSTKMNERYSGLVLDQESYYSNTLALHKFERKLRYQGLRRKNDIFQYNDFHFNPPYIKSEYFHLKNHLRIPARYLQGVLFDPEAPSYSNYGGIGFFIGQEMAHGFDSQGVRFDYQGKKNNWWSKDSMKKFEEKVNCIIHQHSNYSPKQINVKLNGIRTQTQIIADTVGVKLAYQAYSKIGFNF